MESSINQVKQYGRRNNIIISGIPEDISDNDLESKDVDVDINSSDIQACHRIGKSDGEQQVRKLLFVLYTVNIAKKYYYKKQTLRP